jgi:polyisoprenoid-binding protein YceI
VKNPLLVIMAISLTLLTACAADATTAPTLPAVSDATTQPTTAPTTETVPTTTEAAQVTVAAPTATNEPTEAPTEAAANSVSFVLVAAESEARFIVDEVLFGAPKTVIGTTHDVSGSLVPDFQTPANTTVGTITIDLSTLQTDNGNRTRTMHNTILETSMYRYAEFVPTSISGMPESITIGEPFTFQITGNLTMHGTTVEKTFDVTATAVSDTRIEGLATLQILYSEFGIDILHLPQQVASVSEEVILELEFVAEPG